MAESFIRNHQYNCIKKQAGIVQHALKTVADPKVMEAVRYSAESKVLEAFPHVTDIQKQMLQRISVLNTTEDFQQYLNSVLPFLLEFPQVTENQIKKLFPKNKKLRIPDLKTIDYRYVTYFSWIDISTNKLFIVYNLKGKVIGVEGKYTLTNKKGICFLCNGHGEVALFSAITKTKLANSSPDYYKAIGNYMCINGHDCNKNIMDVTSLEGFIQDVIG